MVCAMELGLLTESCPRTFSLAAARDDPALAKTDTGKSKKEFLPSGRRRAKRVTETFQSYRPYVRAKQPPSSPARQPRRRGRPAKNILAVRNFWGKRETRVKEEGHPIDRRREDPPVQLERNSCLPPRVARESYPRISRDGIESASKRRSLDRQQKKSSTEKSRRGGRRTLKNKSREIRARIIEDIRAKASEVLRLCTDEILVSTEEEEEDEEEEEEEEDEGFGGETSIDYDWDYREKKTSRRRKSSWKDGKNTPANNERNEFIDIEKRSDALVVENDSLISDFSSRKTVLDDSLEETWRNVKVMDPREGEYFSDQEKKTDFEDVHKLPLSRRILEEERANRCSEKINASERGIDESSVSLSSSSKNQSPRSVYKLSDDSIDPAGVDGRIVGSTKESDVVHGSCNDAKESDTRNRQTLGKNVSPRGGSCNIDSTRSCQKSRDSRKDSVFHDGRRVTRGLTKINKENYVGKLVWGSCSGWWPALIIDAEHVGMLPESGKLWVYWIGEAQISLLNEKTQIESFSCNLESRLMQNSSATRSRAIDATIQMLRKRFDCTLTKPYHSWIENNCSGLNGPTLDEIKFYPYPPDVQRRVDRLKERNAKVTEKYLLEQKRSPKKSTDRSRESTQRNNVDTTRLPLREQNPGVITWAKIAGHNWWPAMIIDYRDCCMREPSFGCQWIMWYGDYKLSEVHHNSFLKFDRGMEKMRDYINRTKKHVYLVGVLQASKDYCSRLGRETNNWTLVDAFKYFSKASNVQEAQSIPHSSRDSIKIYNKYSTHIVKKLNELKNDPNIDDKRQDDIKNSDDLRSVTNGKVALETLCLKCLKITSEPMEDHPFFEGSLCKRCSEEFKPLMFLFGNDGKCFYCTICGGSGTVVICDREDCPRVYCTACLKYLLCPKEYDDVLLEDPWECFLCKDPTESPLLSDMIIKPRPNWKDKIIDMFRTSSGSKAELIKDCGEKRKIRVLSLFDGLSTGLLVLLKLGLTVDVYYASEIDKDALMVSTSHFGDRIIHLGDVKDITREKIKEIAPIDLLIGGSPCNDLSLANPARLGLHDPKGTGMLFFEYCRIMELTKKANKGHRLFWLYENVASMPTEYRLEINKHLGQEPDVIDSADFSPQHRLRLYWHNLPIEPHSLSFQGEQDVQDILTPHCQRYALVKKIRTVTTKVNSLKQGKSALKPILMKDESDTLWITELEEIFGFPRHYTDVRNLSATKRQKLIGKSWSVQTLTAILRSLCPFFECSTNELQRQNRNKAKSC